MKEEKLIKKMRYFEKRIIAGFNNLYMLFIKEGEDS